MIHTARGFCSTLRISFTREGVRLPLPWRWAAEFCEIDCAARRLARVIAEIPSSGKPRILAKWEKELPLVPQPS